MTQTPYAVPTFAPGQKVWITDLPPDPNDKKPDTVSPLGEGIIVSGPHVQHVNTIDNSDLIFYRIAIVRGRYDSHRNQEGYLSVLPCEIKPMSNPDPDPPVDAETFHKVDHFLAQHSRHERLDYLRARLICEYAHESGYADVSLSYALHLIQDPQPMSIPTWFKCGADTIRQRMNELLE